MHWPGECEVVGQLGTLLWECEVVGGVRGESKADDEVERVRKSLL